MKTLTGEEFCRILQSRGWQLKRIKGSHRIYTRAGISARISVPVHAGGDLKRGLQTHPMKIARIKESNLYDLDVRMFQGRTRTRCRILGLSNECSQAGPVGHPAVRILLAPR